MSTRESCATALWATADANEPQQRFVAQQIGVRLVMEMLLSNSRKLQFIGCQVHVQHPKRSGAPIQTNSVSGPKLTIFW